MEVKEILISEAPEILKNTVEKHIEDMAKYGGVELLTVQQKNSTPYKDKTEIRTTYSAFLQNGNFLQVFRYDPKISPTVVEKDGLIIGEITTFIKHSEWMKSAAKSALEE